MGRRKKSGKKVIKKKKPTVATVFKCLYCGHDKCVECKLDLAKAIGTLNCRVCGESFQMRINLDVFCEWLDKQEGEGGGEGDEVDVAQEEAEEDRLFGAE
eukprot:g6181.t1